MRLRPLRLVLPLAALIAVGGAVAQQASPPDSAADAARALADATAQGEAARIRAEQLEQAARSAVAEADRTAQEGAGIAARIQQAEAGIAANTAAIAVIERQRGQLRAQLAQHQQPLVRLTAALQRLSRRPAMLSLLRPGSLRDAVYMRAVLQTILPVVERRTAGLRAEIDKGRALEAQAQDASRALRASQDQFAQRRQALAALESRQRLASREASGIADREAERALALAEQARDLGGLVTELDKQGALRAQLAALPGPILRPAQPAAAQVAAGPEPASPRAPALARFMLPVAGRLVQGFGEQAPGKARSRGISLAANASAQAVAPAAGRVVFAGPFAGYGQIVIIDHGDGWTSLITGLVQLDTQVGQRLVGGSPLGLTGPARQPVTLELRRGGEPVNPLDFVRG
jgi:septal ring factor EnvC (AmiA/AmiB activator)